MILVSLPDAVINISDRLTVSFGGFHYSMPDYIIKKLFYEKNINGNLSQSSLYRLVKAYLRSKSLDSFNEVLSEERRLGSSEEHISEVISSLQKVAELDFNNRRLSGIKDLQTSYQKSKF